MRRLGSPWPCHVQHHHEVGQAHRHGDHIVLFEITGSEAIFWAKWIDAVYLGWVSDVKRVIWGGDILNFNSLYSVFCVSSPYYAG